jgi:DNA-directed RNA polymerase subunit RPC12/RpoP
MPNKKIKPPHPIREPIQFKLYDFYEEFSDFRSDVSKKLIGCQDMSPNLIRLEKNGEIIFNNNIAVCPVCGSKHNIKGDKIERELIIMDLGTQICKIQRYKCSKCNNIFNTDLSSLVEVNKKITKPVIDFIIKSYNISGDSICNDSIRKIRYMLKEIYNVDISYQSIENILVDFENELKEDF